MVLAPDMAGAKQCSVDDGLRPTGCMHAIALRLHLPEKCFRQLASVVNLCCKLRCSYMQYMSGSIALIPNPCNLVVKMLDL